MKGFLSNPRELATKKRVLLTRTHLAFEEFRYHVDRSHATMEKRKCRAMDAI